MTPLREAFIRMPITYSLKLLWWTATLFITTITSINAAQPQSRPLSGLSDISVEINTPRKKGCRNRPTESSSPEKEITKRSLRERTFIALFHNFGSFPVSLWSFRSFIHCSCSCFVKREVLSSSCNGQKSDCCKGRWFPVLNKSFVHQNRRKEMMFAFLCGCVETPYSWSSFIFLKKKRQQWTRKKSFLAPLAPFEMCKWLHDKMLSARVFWLPGHILYYTAAR